MESSISEGTIAFDMLYRPNKTPFLGEAEQAGCKVIEGWKMLLNQGAATIKIWTGRAAPIEPMQKALKQELGIN